MTTTDRRAQAFTVEGFVAAFLLLASIAFALQATAVSPLSASTSGQHVENQQAAVARGLLDTAVVDGSLTQTLLFWNPTNASFHDTDPTLPYYTACATSTGFGDALARTFEDRGLACNVYLHHVDANGSLDTQRLVYAGLPSDGAVAAATTVTLYDDDVLLDAAGNQTAWTLASVAADANATFYASDTDPAGSVYAVVRLEVVVWRT